VWYPETASPSIGSDRQQGILLSEEVQFLMVRPHGGKLIDRALKGKEAESAAKAIAKMKSLTLDRMSVVDLRNIGVGRYSPLEGFIGKADLEAVVKTTRLKNGVVWSIPILLDVSEDEARALKEGEDICLKDEAGKPIAILHLAEKYTYPKQAIAKSVFGTDDLKHPGVKSTMEMKDVFLAGQIDLVDTSKEPFPKYNLTPSETRRVFEEKGWKTVVGFQTRNAPHNGHEHMQKVALSMVDGLFINPVIGKKKKGDFTDEAILKAYDVLLAEYFPGDRAFMSILPMEMRYAGPKEAIHHAIIRKNFGCTHLIVGRDHAGVGNYYEPEAAIDIFKNFGDLEISPLTIRGDFFHCKKCAQLESERTCPHADDQKIKFSGTVIRKMLVEGGSPPPEIFRPEVFEALRQIKNPFVE
jgi:sulfate adenylyltransferase